MAHSKDHYELYIAFVGMVGFVPRTQKLENSGEEVVTRATAILPRVDDEEPYTLGNGKQLPTHFPFLKLVVGKTAKPQGSEAQPKSYPIHSEKLSNALEQAKIETKRWSVDRRELSITLPNGHSPHTLALQHLRGLADPFPFDRAELADSTWMSTLSEIYATHAVPAGAAKIDPVCLSGPHPRVATRFDLPGGGLINMGLSEHDDQIVPYVFRCLAAGGITTNGNRAICEHMVLRTTIHDPDGVGIVLASAPLDRSDPSPSKRWAVNIEPGELFGRRKILLILEHLPEHSNGRMHSWNDPVGHFELFYELSSQAKKLGPKLRPVPHATAPTGRRSLGMVIPGAGNLDDLRKRKKRWWQSSEKKAMVDLAHAVSSEMFKGTGTPICPKAQYDPELYRPEDAPGDASDDGGSTPPAEPVPSAPTPSDAPVDGP